jgi:hypothetical protein
MKKSAAVNESNCIEGLNQKKGAITALHQRMNNIDFLQ